MSNVATILGNILDMDVFLDCPTKKEDEAMVVFHARPEKIVSIQKILLEK